MKWSKRKSAAPSAPTERTPSQVAEDRLLAYINRELNDALAKAQKQALTELQLRLKSEGIDVTFT